MLKVKPFQLILLMLIAACGTNSDDARRTVSQTEIPETIWYRQTEVDLGAKVKMLDENTGWAISRGRGEVPGKLLKYESGGWKEIKSFPYSDYPQLEALNDSTVWFLIHETHGGFYRPRLFEISGSSEHEIPLPRIMWDKTDFVMFRGLWVNQDGTAWLAGQQGNILRYDGRMWKESNSPLTKLKSQQNNLMAGNLHSVQFVDAETGYAAGKAGAILKYSSGNWREIDSPVMEDLNALLMFSEGNGMAVGAGGVILQCENDIWGLANSPTTSDLFDVCGSSRYDVWIAGANSTLFHRDGKAWRRDLSAEALNDEFQDIEIFGAGMNSKIWLTGNRGIYTNSRELTFSFSDITTQLSIQREGIAGHFFDADNNRLPDLIIQRDEGAAIMYLNRGDAFVQSPIEKWIEIGPAAVIAAGDINNDGNQDLFALADGSNFSVHLGDGDGGFDDITELTGFNFDNFISGIPSAKFADFNNDGALDLYFSNSSGPDYLYVNNGAGQFVNVIDSTGMQKAAGASSVGCVLNDFDGNGFVDVFLPYRFPVNGRHADIFLNNRMKFEKSADPAFGAEDSRFTLSAISADFNNDTFPDIIVFNVKTRMQLFINDGFGRFTDRAEENGLSKFFAYDDPSNGVLNAADVNNDGWIDFFAGDRLFLNSPGMNFKDVTSEAGLNFKGNPTFADIDDDGDVDMFVAVTRSSSGTHERVALLRNNLSGSGFVKIKALGDESNRDAAGTKIRFTSWDENGAAITREVTTGLGGAPIADNFGGEIIFGANSGDKYEAKLKFPSGNSRTINGLVKGGEIEVKESGWFERLLILTSKSISRTNLLLTPGAEFLKLAILLFLFLPVYYWGKQSKLKKSFISPMLYSGILLVYILTVHFNAYESIWYRTILSYSSALIFGAAYINFSLGYRKKIAAQYISNYRLEKEIGSGGMGKVFLAADSRTKQKIALKVLHTDLMNDPENKKRLKHEGELLASLEHHAIVKVFEVSETREQTFIAMEYLPGGTLEDHIREIGKLPQHEIVDLSLQICEGLELIHSRGIIHRDLKSRNIMFDENLNVRIMDFGLSKSPLVSTMTSLGTVVGTLGYVAPEQVMGTEVDSRTDIFSLGVVMYEMATGTLPFKGENEIALIHSIFNKEPEIPEESAASLGAELSGIILKCLNKDPEQRFANVAELSKQLRKLID